MMTLKTKARNGGHLTDRVMTQYDNNRDYPSFYNQSAQDDNQYCYAED